MKLRTLTVANVGPFTKEKMTFEADVTVITGRNDTGKSALLKLIKMVCAHDANEVAGEMDVNFDHLVGATRVWDEDTSLEATAEFEYPENGKLLIAKYTVKLAPKNWSSSTFSDHRGGFSVSQMVHLIPHVLSFRPHMDEGVRQQLNLHDPNATEKRFLGVAFGPDFKFAALKELSDLTYENAIARAEDQLNSRLATMMPKTLPFRFRFRNRSDKRELLFVNLMDEHGASTALGQRGTGVQTMINLLGRLATENLGGKDTLLLFDEPETSLHADAQHTLRRSLEKLGLHRNIQVIYATHSPCMVNCMRPRSVRLLTRIRQGSTGYTKMELEPYSARFASVRSSLGISPADSLLYSPVTIVVEGKTEIVCLPILLQKLEAAKVDGFMGVTQLLSLSIFVEAEGSPNVSNLCRLAKAQGTRVIAFCDGDLGERWKNQLERQHPDVTLIMLAKGEEFEEMVPRAVYFKAIADWLGKPGDEVSETAYEGWMEVADLNPRLAFTKRVDRWITDSLGGRGLEKAVVMQKAVDMTPENELKLQPLRELVTHMHKAFSS